MDSLTTQYRDVVEKILLDYANFLGNDDEVQVELVFDRERDRYLLVEAGWQNGYRIYGTLLHIDIINNKLWIQHDGTEEGIAGELVAAGNFQRPHRPWFQVTRRTKTYRFCYIVKGLALTKYQINKPGDTLKCSLKALACP